MTDAAAHAKLVLDSPWNGDLAQLEIFLTNAFKRAQAEAFDHAAGLLKEHACALHPSIVKVPLADFVKPPNGGCSCDRAPDPPPAA